MKIYELVKELNKKVSVKHSVVLDVKKYYLSMYRTSMLSLYDKGYISDPTVFDVREFYKNILDMNINHLSGVTGVIHLEEDYIGYALARYKDDVEISGFLSLLLDAVKYRNVSMNIDKFYDEHAVSNNKKKISLNIVQSASRIFSKNGYKLDEGIFKCLYGITSGSSFISLKGEIYEKALQVLGLDEVVSNNALFVKGLTRDEEIKYCNLILNGLVKLDGEYADKLTGWLSNNKWSTTNKFSSQKEGLYNWVTIIRSNDMIERQSGLLNTLISSGKTIIGADTVGYYILEDRDFISMPIGVFAVSSSDDEDTILPNTNILEGYTGEVYAVSYLTSNDISYVGCPIELFNSDGKKALFVDKEQTDMKDSISWFKHIDASVSFDENFVKSSKFTSGTLELKLFEAAVNSERGVLVSNIPCIDYLDITDSIKKSVAKNLD